MKANLLAADVRLGARLAVQLDELGLVVEKVERGWRARHVQVDDVLGLGSEVRISRGQGVIDRGSGEQVLVQK